MKKEIASKVDNFNINNTEPMELVVTASAGCVMLAEAAKGAGLSKEERAKAIDICISMLKDMKMWGTLGLVSDISFGFFPKYSLSISQFEGHLLHSTFRNCLGRALAPDLFPFSIQ